MSTHFHHQKLTVCLGVLLLLSCLVSALHAQETKIVSDLCLWTEIKAEKELSDFSFSVSQHLRFHKNITGFDDYISEAAVEYSINKNFEIGVAGRYTRNNHYNEIAENDYRYDLFFQFDKKISERIKFYSRLKYQKEFYGSGVFNRFLHYYETTYRYRAKIGWEKSDGHRFYTSAEIFRLTKKLREPFWDKYRLWLGDDLSSEIGDFDLAFGLNAN
ncbi:MAG TPA: DUF2490 domain-containing protein [Prolixibacteraceae bacterium]|nr:DUF2490 domain-containing protein [Prolixibacteraceae bacterium]